MTVALTPTLTRAMASDPPGYPGGMNRMLDEAPVIPVGVVARTLHASDDADLLNPIVPEAYGASRPRLRERPSRSQECWTFDLDASGRVLRREAMRAGRVLWTDTFEWTDTAVRGRRSEDGRCSKVWAGEVRDGRLLWLASAAPTGVGWFRFAWEDGHVTFAVRKINLAAEVEAYRVEWDGDGIARVWRRTWSATSMGIDPTGDESPEFTSRRGAPRLGARAKRCAVDEVTRLAQGLGERDALLLVYDLEEPAFPPRAVLLTGDARYSDERIRERIAAGPYDADLELGVPDATLDAINTADGAHRRLRRFAKDVLAETAARGEPGPALGVCDFEVSQLEWVRPPAAS